MQKLQKKIEEYSMRKKEVGDRIANLNAEKKKAAEAANEALAKGDIDSAMEYKKLQDQLEADIKALEGIMAAFRKEKPFNTDEFFEEFNEFEEQQEAALSEKYNKLVKGLVELDKLYSDYEAQYRWYESQYKAWQDMGDKISLGQLPKVINKVFGLLHMRIKSGLTTLNRFEKGRLNQ